MINTLLEHVPLSIKLEVLEALQNDSEGTDSDILDDETTLMISSDEEAELEAQRIRFHELVGRNLLLRESGRRSTSSSGSSSVMVLSEKGGTSAAAELDEVGEAAKCRKKRVHSTTSVASSIGTSNSEMESCGNICIHQAQAKLIFNCSFCDLRYADMQVFAEHLHDSHKLFTAPAQTEVAQPKSPLEQHLQEQQQQNLRKSARVVVKTAAAVSVKEAAELASVKTEPDVLVAAGPAGMQEPLESCGNIFVLKRQKLFLICGYCECRYATPELFSRHLRQQHQLLEGPIKEILVEPKEEIKFEVIVIDEPTIEQTIDDATPQPMVAIPEGMALDNNDLLIPVMASDNNDLLIPMSSLDCCSKSNSSGVRTPIQQLDNNDLLVPMSSLDCCSKSNSSGVRTPMQRVSTETPPPEEGEAKLPTSTRPKRKRAEPSNPNPNPKLTSRKTRKTTAAESEPPVAVVVSKRLRRTSANKPKPTSKDLNVQPPSSPESAITERLDLEQHSAPNAEIINEIEQNEKEQEHNCETEPQPTPELEVEPLPCANPATSTNSVKRTPTVLNCDQCLKTFTKATRLIEHQRTHTGEKPFKCYVCGKSFRVKMRLVEHAMRHRAEKAFKCDLCGHPMATKQDLVLHQRHHKGDKRYTCPHCPKAFVRGSDLKIHVRIHTGEKPFSCEICQKAFRANQNLIVHRKTHRDERPFKCDYCDKHFMRNIDRKVHHRTHTGEKPYKCEICEKAYSSLVHLRSHLYRDHVKGGTLRKKPGPKPKHIKEDMERHKKMFQKLKEQAFEHIQHQPPTQQTSPHVQRQTIQNERIREEEAMQHVSLALQIALEDDDSVNDNDAVDLTELLEKENYSTQLVVDATATATVTSADVGVLQRKRRSVTASQKERKISSYFAVVGQKTEI